MTDRMNVKLDAETYHKLRDHVDRWNEAAEQNLGPSHKKLTLGEALGQAVDYFIGHPSLLLQSELSNLEQELIAKQREVMEKFEKLKDSIEFESEDGSITFKPWKSRHSNQSRKGKKQ